jgi:hypothetical protein
MSQSMAAKAHAGGAMPGMPGMHDGDDAPTNAAKPAAVQAAEAR